MPSPNYIAKLTMPNGDVYTIKDDAAQTLIESIKNNYFGNLVHQVDTNGNVYNFYKANDTTTALATITLATSVTSSGNASSYPVTSGAVASAISDMASATDLSTLAGRVTTVENNYTALMDNADVEKVINSFNEVVAFLAGVTTDDTLIGKLNDLNSGKLADVKIESGKLKKKFTDTGGYDTGTNVVTDVKVGTTSVVSSGVATITMPTWSTLKPSGGIPASDLAGDIPKTALATAVQTSLGLADTSVQSVSVNGGTAVTPTNGNVNLSIASSTWSDVLPSGGIPKTDLASAVQTSLGKADSAIQGVKKNGKTLSPDSNKVIDISDVVTTVKMNGSAISLTKDSSTGGGEINLGTVITSHQSWSDIKPAGGIPGTDLADTYIETVAGSNGTAVAPNSAGNVKVDLTGTYTSNTETLALSITVSAPTVS